MTSISKILVVRLSSIGDIILTTPLLRSLKKAYPQAHITFIIKKQYQDLLRSSPYIDDLVVFDQNEGLTGLKRIKNSLKEKRFDLFLDIHKNWRSRYLRIGLNAVKTTTYHKFIFRRTLLIWFKWNFFGKTKPVYDRYYDSVKHLGIQYDGEGTTISVPETIREKTLRMISGVGYQQGVPLIIVCPSATYLNKRWLPEGFVETARYVIKEKSAFVIILGGPEDNMLCNEIAAKIGDNSISLAGALSLIESAALLSLATLVIANDSGLLHMAQSQKIPVVGIYGPTTRELGYFPIEQKSTVIETMISCRPCTHNGLNKCPKGHFRCMKNITAEMVIKAALQYIP